MPKFRNLKDLEKYVQQKVEKAVKGNRVSSIFKHTMQDKVYTEVYDYYTPKEYERRGANEGLADANNMNFTEHKKEGNTLVSLFENLTVGNSDPEYGHPTDSMNGYFISSLIENGSTNIHTTDSNSSNGWYSITHLDGSKGEWTDARPFAKATAQTLNDPSSPFNKALKLILETEINK